MSLRVIPLTFRQANAAVLQWHRHHKPARGQRFSIGVEKRVGDDWQLCGAAIVGRPVARACDPYRVAEVTRLVTDGTHNACLILYAACARAADAMGFKYIQTYILDSELGTSLKASGWQFADKTAGGQWTHSEGYKGKSRNDQPTVPKQRWEKHFKRSA